MIIVVRKPGNVGMAAPRFVEAPELGTEKIADHFEFVRLPEKEYEYAQMFDTLSALHGLLS